MTERIELTKKKTIEVIGIPMDLGQTLRGVDLGPGALRYAGLRSRLRSLDYDLIDHGNLPVPIRDALPDIQQKNYLPAIRDVCVMAYEAARAVAERKNFALFLGGDHSIAIGTIGGITHYGPAGLLYVDAHGDFNTPESSSTGNIHGMALATLIGQGQPELVGIGRNGPKLKPEDVILLGVRELDTPEQQALKKSGVTVFTMRDIDERGISSVANEALQCLKPKRLHVSLDVDAIDPVEAPGVGTAVPGGLSYREALLLCEIIADTQRMVSLDIVEINPILDHQNRTAQVAADLAASLFGKKII